ncbi:MAG TPA: large conductance mechanosensitive channel protein MscL [Pyrinomonadaceae bacterium]|nr:large conductance mechanosensitive channel protein MscL [Pyrinomonadaceae bacterium]
MWNDFKAFIAKGNVLDLAVAVVIGAAFGKIITTMVEGVIMPIVGLATGGVDFKSKFIDLSGKMPSGATADQIEAAKKAGAPLLMYGQLIADIITFLIVAFVVFLIARWAVKLFKGLEAAAAGPSAEEVLLTEIRDLLAKK